MTEQQKPNQNELNRIVTQYGTMLVRIAFTYLKSMADAEDIVQDVLKSSWYQQSVPLSFDMLKDQINGQSFTYIEAAESEVIQLVLQLAPKYRIPIYLHYGEGYSIKELAQMLHHPAASIGTLLHRGKKQLQKLLEVEKTPQKGVNQYERANGGV